MVDHKYPTFDIRLCAMMATVDEGELLLNDHEKVMWVSPKDLQEIELTPADKQIAAAIV